MGIILAFVLVPSLWIILKVIKVFSKKSTALPNIDVNQNWGSSADESVVDSPLIEAFEVDFEKKDSDLIESLRNTLEKGSVRPTQPLDGIGFEYGVNSVGFKDFLDYWGNNYLLRWSERQTILNKFPQFTTEIQGLKIHFVHTKSSAAGKNVIPILMLHGWPGTVRDFFEVIPQITQPDAILHNTVFDVVVPSLPGFGWSQATQKQGLGVTGIAVIMRNLMLKLGYKRFYIHGEDIGSEVGSALATLYPDNVIGFHSTMLIDGSGMGYLKEFTACWWPSLFVYKKYQEFFFPLIPKYLNFMQESGYIHIQASKPDTIGIVLSQSPIGLAAYLLEKYSTWTHPENRKLIDGGWSKFQDSFKDAIIDNIMVYYLSGCITTSCRLYSGGFTAAEAGYGVSSIPTQVPTAYARFRQDMMHTMDWKLRDKYPRLLQSTYHWVGGHFAMLEVPTVYANDFIEFVRLVNRNEIDRRRET